MNKTIKFIKGIMGEVIALVIAGILLEIINQIRSEGDVSMQLENFYWIIGTITTCILFVVSAKLIKNRWIKREENKETIEKDKKILAEEYKAIIKEFYSFMERYKNEQIWRKAGIEDNKEPKEVTQVYEKFREFDKMLDKFLISLG